MSDRKIAAVRSLHAAARILAVTLVFITTSLSPVQAQTTSTSAERKELLEVRRLVWESYFLNDQAKLKELIGEDFITINPGDEHWQNRAEFVDRKSVV